MYLQGAQALTYDELQGLTYLQVKGSGIANTCPVLEGGSSNLKDLKPGAYQISKFCLEPTSFTVKEESQFKTGEPEFVKTKLMTRLTYTLDEVWLLYCCAAIAVLLNAACTSHVHTAPPHAPCSTQLSLICYSVPCISSYQPCGLKALGHAVDHSMYCWLACLHNYLDAQQPLTHGNCSQPRADQRQVQR